MSTFRITPKDVGRTSMCRKAFVTARIIAYDPGTTNRPVKVQYSDGKIIWLFKSGNLLWGKDSDLDLVAWTDEPATNQPRPKDFRDEFAMVALQGLLSNSGGAIQSNAMNGWGFVNCELEDVTTLSYSIADAMMKARGK